MSTKLYIIQFALGSVIGGLIACSPTKFSQPDLSNSLCDSSVTNCVVQNNYAEVTQDFKVGSGKVDILFVNDNSASMSKVQTQLAVRFSGFIQSLDAKSIDYRIAMTTTDLSAVQGSQKLVTFGNGSKYLTRQDSNRVNLFNSAIIRSETIQCEEFITFMFTNYGTSFQSQPSYHSQYPIKCPSADTRGVYTASVVVSENASSFLRSDANLNIILISNDNARQGKTLENSDKAEAFVSLMQQKYPTKYWDFNSIVVKDLTCRDNQTLKTSTNQVVRNESGPAIVGGLGLEYAKLSNTAARDIDNNVRPRGKILDICQSDYAQHFTTMSTQIAEDARMFSMKCTPESAPSVQATDNRAISYTWSGDKVIFAKGTEGRSVRVVYSCYTGPT